MTQQFNKKTGIVLRMFDAQEADRVVHILTSEGSRDAIIAKGIRRLKSRKAHAVDLLNRITYKTVAGKQLEVLTDVQLLDSHAHWKHTYIQLIALQTIAEITSGYTQESNSEIAYYMNLQNLLQVDKVTKPLLLVAAYLLRCLYVHGSLAMLSEDVLTGETIEPEQPRYVYAAGGYTIQSTGAASISDRLYKSQRFILRHDFRAIQQLDLSSEEQLTLFDTHLIWHQAALETNLKSANMLRDAHNSQP